MTLNIKIMIDAALIVVLIFKIMNLDKNTTRFDMRFNYIFQNPTSHFSMLYNKGRCNRNK